MSPVAMSLLAGWAE